MTIRINVPQCVHLIRNLDNVGYLPLASWKDLDTVVETIQKSETYKGLWDDVKAKAEELMKELKEKNTPIDEEVNKLNLELFELEKSTDKKAKKERKIIRQKIQDLATEGDKNIKYAQQALLDYQDHKMDLDAREIYIVEVDDGFYQVLDAKFHIDDKKFNPEDKTSGFVERVETDNLSSDVEIPDTTVVENEIKDEEK